MKGESWEIAQFLEHFDLDNCIKTRFFFFFFFPLLPVSASGLLVKQSVWLHLEPKARF